MKQPNVLILGGGYAGLMAASRVARQRVAKVTLIDQSPQFEQRIRLHQVLAGQPVMRGDLSSWLAAAGVDFVTSGVREIHPASRKVITSTGTYYYDYLIFTLGSYIAHHRIEGAIAHAHTLRSQQDCQALSAQIATVAGMGGRLLLIGGGLTHIETAAELAEKYPSLHITLVCAGSPFSAFAPKAEHYFRDYLGRKGIQLQEGCTVHSVRQGSCETTRGRIDFDLGLCAPGFMASPLLTCLGEPLTGCGSVRVLSTLQLPTDDRILIAGDSAACPWPGPVPLRMGCAVALPMGAQAGENVAALIKGRQPEIFSFGFITRCVSLGRKHGVIQTTRWDDTPKDRIVTGAMGAWIKEQVCSMTFHLPRWELRTGLRLYRWPSVPEYVLADAMDRVDSLKG